MRFVRLDRRPDPLHLALEVLRANPQRTALSVAAVAAAVATLVVVDTSVAAIGRTATRNVARAFGADTFVIAQVASSGRLDRRTLAARLERNPPIRGADVRFLEQFAGGRVLYAATAQRAADVVAGERKFEGALVSGTQAALADIRDLALEQGRFFTAGEETRATPVAVLGREVADQLFPAGGELGGAVRIAGRAFEVVGVQSRLGTTGGITLDRYVWVPLPAWERAFGAARTLQVSAHAPGALPVDLAEDRARATLRARHHLAPGVEDDFDLLAPEAARDFVMALARRIGAAAPLLGGAALLAAAVVVANTMLVSVARRTFEIGVRRAVGATRADIARQVLAESALVALAGGVLGVLAVLALTRAVAAPAGLELVVRPGAAAAAVAAAGLTGLAAGWLPARRAARVDPVVALRSEP